MLQRTVDNFFFPLNLRKEDFYEFKSSVFEIIRLPKKIFVILCGFSILNIIISYQVLNYNKHFSCQTKWKKLNGYVILSNDIF